MLAEKGLKQLSSERLWQILTNTDADTQTIRLIPGIPIEELGEGLKEPKAPYLSSVGGETLGLEGLLGW